MTAGCWSARQVGRLGGGGMIEVGFHGGSFDSGEGVRRHVRRLCATAVQTGGDAGHSWPLIKKSPPSAGGSNVAGEEFGEDFCWFLPVEDLTGSAVDLAGDGPQVVRVVGDVGAFGKVFA